MIVFMVNIISLENYNQSEMQLEQKKPQNIIDKGEFLKAKPITPKDDAFHGRFTYLDIEWWYFDAVLEDGYSVHVGVRTYHSKLGGVVKTRIEMYKDGKIIVGAKKFYLFNVFKTSKIFPLIKINDKKIVDFDNDYYNKTGKWIYNVKHKINRNEINLEFSGTTPGWKIETDDTCWTVALPKATVNGSIKLNGKKMEVKGVGYHDHNWRYSPTTALNNLGWFWGRITADSLSFAWANTIATEKKHQLLSIVNQDNNSNFFSIKPQNITFIPLKIVRDHRCWIPTEFNLSFKKLDENNIIPVEVDINMKTFDIHYDRIFTIQYWRYHVYTNGYIKVGSKTEKLENKPQIIEFLSFKKHKKNLFK